MASDLPIMQSQPRRAGQRPEPTTFDGKLADRLFRINAARLLEGRRNLTLDQVQSYVSSKGINTEDDEVFEHLLTADVPEPK